MRSKALLVLAFVAFSLGAVSNAFSADLGSRSASPVYSPPLPPINWNGYYVGGFAGGAISKENVAVDGFNYGLDNSFIGGGTLGYNWQFAGSAFLAGIEGELGYMSLTGSAASPSDPAVVSSARVGDWYGVLAGRLGWLATPDWLLYAKGGAAWTELTADVFAHGSNATGSKTTTGWALGGGTEWMFLPQWSVKAEYLFLGIGDNIEACDGGSCFDHNFSGVHTIKVGLNYHF